ncbi:PolC-type DNA polymerase III N-terminal domain-containing protein, partial [Mitsuokella jalaludinii]
MQKFRIVPSRKNMFWQLVQGMRLEEGDKALLREATIRHVEVCTRTNSWEIALSTQTLLPEALLESAADQIAKKCQLDAVVFYQDVVNIEDALAKIWPRLVYETAEGNPTVYELLKRSKYTVDGSHILIDVPGELGGEIMRAHSVTQVMSQIIEKTVGYRCHVECEASEEVLQNLEVDDSFQNPDYIEALQHEKARRAKEARAAEEAAERSAGGVEEGGIPAPAFARTARTADERAPLSRYEAAAPAHETAASKAAAPKPAKKTVKPADHTAHENEPVVMQDRGNLIFGRGVSGALHKITELVGEIKSVVVEGTIGEGPGSGIRLLEFKSGTKLLTFCISDETDGIACKKFFTKGRRRKSGEPELDCDEVMAALKEGMTVRVQGSVRFDTFMNEYVLFVNSLAKKEKKSREDHAEVKRV